MENSDVNPQLINNCDVNTGHVECEYAKEKNKSKTYFAYK